MITVRNLQKTYKIAKPGEGRFATLKALVRPQYEERRAVDGIDFTINDGEMEKLVSRVIVIHAGQIIYDGSMTGLRERYGGEDADIEDIVRKIYREGERTA